MSNIGKRHDRMGNLILAFAIVVTGLFVWHSGFEMADEAERKKVDKGVAKELTELAVAIAKDVLKDEKRIATPEELARIEQAFNDQTDGWFLKVHSTSEDGMDMEISDHPITSEAVPGRSPAHDAARRRGDVARAKQPTKIPVVDGDAEAERRERRRQAGIKSAETRKRNLAKAARAAKKG